jgi:hypothetical protein
MKTILSVTIFAFSMIFSFSSEAQNYIDTDNRVQNLLNRYKKYKKRNNKISVYRIQLFSGERTTANGVLNKAKNLYTEKVNIEYDQPNFKVKLGMFSSKNMAREYLQEVKKNFKTAYVLSEKVSYDKFIAEEEENDNLGDPEIMNSMQEEN